MISSIIVSVLSSDETAVYAVAMLLLNNSFAFGDGISNAAVALVGKSFGAGDERSFHLPAVDPFADTKELRGLAEDYGKRIIAMKPDAVLVAGEFTLVFMLVDLLLKNKLKVLSSCSRRITTEVRKEDGTNEKKSVFQFERFREYAYYEE